MVIALGEAELVYLFKLIEGLDDQDKANVYGVFPQAVTGAAAYADAVVQHLRDQLDPVRAVRAHEGQPEWPPFPDGCTAPGTSPAARVRAAIEHARSLVPVESGNRLVWALIPKAIPDPTGYAEVLAGLLPTADGTPDWLQGVRLIIRDDRSPFVLPALYREKNPHVLAYEPDLTPAAMMDAMAREVADPGLAEPKRMQLLAELAGLDYAHGRFEEAVQKYGVLYAYYERYQVPEMQAFVLSGTGDVLSRLGRLPEAKERYQQGLTLALGTKSLPLIMNLAVAVGDASMALEQHDDAIGHWEAGLKVARALRNPFVEADLME